ncbi:DUF5989 family protein [Stieleria maiorica]|uniref:DUF5989 family protein n=1 Tax=Stieleria maiorica TaxID=2795974 RepID=UPI001F393C42|nr:DUF5989 family protein [Stieleria maiorica]
MPNHEDNDRNSPRTEFEEASDGQPLSLLQEFWVLITENKAWWMIPILLVLSLVGVLLAFASTGAAPFIYTLF